MGFYDEIKNIIYDQFEGVQLYERKINGNCLELELYHQRAVKFLKNIGLKEQKSHEKEIPFSVLQSSKEILTEFVQMQVVLIFLSYLLSVRRGFIGDTPIKSIPSDFKREIISVVDNFCIM